MDPRARGGTAELDRFRRLVNLTILATLVLIVIGGIVRVSDSGLGCGPAGSGTEGWPLCGGRALPLIETSAIIEFTHRAMAGLVAVLIVALAWIAVRRLRHDRWIVRGALAAGLLVFAQAGLGGLTVEHNLEPALVAAHLALAMLLLGLLIALSRAAGPAPARTGGPGLRALAMTTSVLIFATIVAGGYMAGTEREGAEGATTVNGAHLACGEEFPTCLGEFMPFGVSEMTDVHLLHRAFMFLAAAATLALVAAALRGGVRSWAFPALAALLAGQILLGALNVWLGERAALVVAHLTLGTLLWASAIYATMVLMRVPKPTSDQLQAPPRGATAPA